MPLVEFPRRPFGKTGLSVAPLGLAGSYGIDAEATERAFHELSINYFFVTPRMKGLCEGLRRLIRAGHRDKLVLATGPFLPTGSALRAVWEEVARAWARLRRRPADVLVRWRWYLTGNTIATLRRFKVEGKIGVRDLDARTGQGSRLRAGVRPGHADAPLQRRAPRRGEGGLRGAAGRASGDRRLHGDALGQAAAAVGDHKPLTAASATASSSRTRRSTSR